VNNVTRNQYEYFECEATNKIPPSVSKKFKINVNCKYINCNLLIKSTHFVQFFVPKIGSDSERIKILTRKKRN
jgi:hypothetical protein